MEPLKQSEEEVLKLGKKIVRELNLEDSINTLGRWMAHYIAELIYQSENAQSPEAKMSAQKECCDLILKLWNMRENVPNMSYPLLNLKAIIALLNSLIKNDFKYPYWKYINNIPDKTPWNDFIETIRSNSENIFELCMIASMNETMLSKEKEWIEEHQELLTEDEKAVIDQLSLILRRSSSLISFAESGVKLMELSVEERYTNVFNKIKYLLDEQNEELNKLKVKVNESLKRQLNS